MPTLLDRLLALVGLIVLAPLLLLVAGVVKLSSSGPVIYKQQRIGRFGRRFTIFKFRSMSERHAGEFMPEDGLAPGGVEGLDRRTPVGRFLRRSGLDELPQLVNVLRGDMSLVGPRPERPVYDDKFKTDVSDYRLRSRVRPGITGLAQISGLRGQTCVKERTIYDNVYAEKKSLALDVGILAQTPFVAWKTHQE